ncbi:MAG: hypothetical protein K6T33_11470 [Thermomonas hydrothermalis]|uniref:DNA-binding domain-containing protein n=1 Tax=Thermomonas hydrothermalis TaxID=213588 RepID=UPI002356F60D|nr:DNA-binding domain-containing protein [Thermomonas hydrothermalis]MCL6620388.1 hypothetical protein [Thermomonas hydrothermalis]
MGHIAAGTRAHRAPAAPLSPEASAALWRWFDGRPETVKAEARRRLVPVQTVRRLIDSGLRARQAIREAAQAHGLPEATLRRWWYGAGRFPGVAHADPADYLPLLTPRHQGSGHEAEMSPEAWEVIKSDYLRPEQPALAACYRRLREVAPNHGWVVPSYATIARRIEALPWQVRVLAREGKEALARRLPHHHPARPELHARPAGRAGPRAADRRPLGAADRPHPAPARAPGAAALERPGPGRGLIRRIRLSRPASPRPCAGVFRACRPGSACRQADRRATLGACRRPSARACCRRSSRSPPPR